MHATSTLAARPMWFAGLAWQSVAIVALHAADALTTIWAVGAGAVELNAVAAFLLSGGPVVFLAAKLLFAIWVAIGLAWIHRAWSERLARAGAYASVLALVAVVAWNTTMIAFLA